MDEAEGCRPVRPRAPTKKLGEANTMINGVGGHPAPATPTVEA